MGNVIIWVMFSVLQMLGYLRQNSNTKIGFFGQIHENIFIVIKSMITFVYCFFNSLNFKYNLLAKITYHTIFRNRITKKFNKIAMIKKIKDSDNFKLFCF